MGWAEDRRNRKFVFLVGQGTRRVTVYAQNLEQAKERATQELNRRSTRNGVDPPAVWDFREVE